MAQLLILHKRKRLHNGLHRECLEDLAVSGERGRYSTNLPFLESGDP